LYIYNVTTQVQKTIHHAWLEWITNDFAPDIIATGLFSHFQIVKILDIDESDGPTFAVQYFTDSREKYDIFFETHATNFSQKTFEKWNDKIISFRSLMEII
jgi:hypothetical protein